MSNNPRSGMRRLYYAPLPWSVDRNQERHQPWTDACSILDAKGGHVCHLTRGYQPEADTDDDGPSWDNAELIVAAVNDYWERLGKPAAAG